MKSICGINCNQCSLKDSCNGCCKTNGHPFGGNCCLAQASQKKFSDVDSIELLKEKILNAIHSLGISELEKVNTLYSLKGEMINLKYLLPNNSEVTFLNNDDIYLGNQVDTRKGYCYGIVANNDFILVSSYEESGKNTTLILYKVIS